MLLALGWMNANVYAALVVVGLILAIIEVATTGLKSVLAWACLLVFTALAWDAVAGAGWLA